VVLHSFYVELIQINLVSSFNWKVGQKSNFQPWLAWTRPYQSRTRLTR